MCTVSIIPLSKNGFILTSNRDEAPSREALPPQWDVVNGVNMQFPKDEQSGGTWIGMSEKNRLICLLNGGFTIHKRQANYRHSRGLVVTDLLACDAIEIALSDYNLSDIEPFTLAIADWNTELQFYELVWDGTEKYISKLPLAPKLWSSSTLYNNIQKEERQNWFLDYLEENPTPTPQTIKQFHKNAGKGNLDYGVLMDRGVVKTTSITQFIKTNKTTNMSFESLKQATTI